MTIVYTAPAFPRQRASIHNLSVYVQSSLPTCTQYTGSGPADGRACG